ncbi:MAG: hypothetical protein JW965_07120 [Bacteroidales bacterium]|nr:hypothetical protein [Bacteroidales bacterium]
MMRTTFCQLFLILTGILLTSFIHGQSGFINVDSIAVNKIKASFGSYQFSDNGENVIHLGTINTELVQYKTNPIFRDMGGGIMTALTGIGFGSSTEVNWKTSGIIKSDDMTADWIVSLFCEGSIEKERERIENDDGSWSVEVIETYLYYWDENAGGIIIENDDTIGFFAIITNPCENEMLKTWAVDIFPQSQVGKNKPKIRWEVFWRPSPGADYGIIGRLRDNDFAMIRNGTDRKVWIYVNNLFTCMFQSDLDYPGMAKKYRILPYLLINKNIPGEDRPDLYRLSIMSRIISSALSRSQD